MEISFTAFLFARTAKLGVAEGTTLILIPIHIKSGSLTVGGEAVTVGSYLFLKRDVTVEPSFYCLAIMIE